MADDSLMDEDRYELDRATVQAVQVAAETGEAERLADSLGPMHPADIADLLEQVGPEPRQMILKILGSGFDGEILSEIDNPFRVEVIGTLDLPVLVEAVRDLESDDIVDIIQHLDPPLRSTLLNALQGARRVAVEQALAYPEFSAGRLMQREMVAGPEHWTVGDAIDHLRARQDLPEDFYHMILVDPKHRPTGYVALGKILGHPREERLQAIAADSFHIIEAKQEEGEVAYAFNQYHLISAPVVDGDGRLVGVITIDDAMGVLAEEAEEDLLRLAGVSDGSSLADRLLTTIRRRFPWLAVNLVTAVLASAVIAVYEDSIARVVALAILMPIIASMGGNAGTQSLTVAVRAIATKDLTGSNVWRVIRREVLVGVANGLLFAAVMGGVGFLWFGSLELAAVAAAAMLINLVVAGLAGTVIPIALERIRIDPALASGAFVTTVTDVVGFLAFLGIAAAVLM